MRKGKLKNELELFESKVSISIGPRLQCNFAQFEFLVSFLFFSSKIFHISAIIKEKN